MNTKKMLCGAFAVGTVLVATATPEVTEVTMSQASDRLVTISYKLSEPAVVTLDVQTNGTGGAWSSIGGKAICNAEGAVWRKVTTADLQGDHYVITWRPDQSWVDANGNGFKIAAGGAKAVVTAWALDNTPDYMVVDLTATAGPDTQRYYTSTNFLPGGLLGNVNYRQGLLVMRKIMAKGVRWTMGSTRFEALRNQTPFSEDLANDIEKAHQVELTNNYYIGVFELTQAQWAHVTTNATSILPMFREPGDRAMRPMENISYNCLRCAADSHTAVGGYYPDVPYTGSFLDLLRRKTGIDFDLPSEAQWEFAARAGNGDVRWGNGKAILNTAEDANLTSHGRYKFNGGMYADGGTIPTALSETTPTAVTTRLGSTNATAIVGTYAPNNWGLYDCGGNVSEWCLDWFAADISSYNGQVNANGTKTLSGATPTNNHRVFRGGAFGNDAGRCRPAARNHYGHSEHFSAYGVRVVCTAGLK